MSNSVREFELARDPAGSNQGYLERRNRHDAERRRRVSVMLRSGAGLLLDLMLTMPTDVDPDIPDLQHFLSIAGRLEHTAEILGRRIQSSRLP